MKRSNGSPRLARFLDVYVTLTMLSGRIKGCTGLVKQEQADLSVFGNN